MGGKKVLLSCTVLRVSVHPVPGRPPIHGILYEPELTDISEFIQAWNISHSLTVTDEKYLVTDQLQNVNIHIVKCSAFN
jgi:hypothetical protein